MKTKHCQTCGMLFEPLRSMQNVCSPRCALRKVKADKAKGARQLRERKAKLKTLADHKANAQKLRNQRVLLRDLGEPCISCGTTTAAAYQAGHYRSRGSAPHLALDMRNISRQCIRCNLHLHGNPIGYRQGLVAKHGEAFVVELEADQEPRHYSVDDYKAMQSEDRRAIKEMKETT